MYRFLLLILLLAGVGAGRPVRAQAGGGLPARPVPFTFVTDQGQLLHGNEARKLDGGLRAYADKTGTQVVVVTVPSLGGRPVADYARALGTAWGVGQRGQNNGVVVLLSAQEHQVSIQPGAGLAGVITPAVTRQVISEMTPDFKQGNYFNGLRAGLNRLLATANPSSVPGQQAAGTGVPGRESLHDNTAPLTSADPALPSNPAGAQQSEVAAPAAPGLGLGTLLIGALVIGGGLWFVIRLFRRKSAPAQRGGTPDFYPNSTANAQPGQPTFYPTQGGPAPGNYPTQNNNGGSGMGGILATGAAAAAGAYLGNRLGGSHDAGSAPQHFDNGSSLGAGAAAASAGTGAADDYFSSRGGNADASNDNAPDYFSGNDTDNSGDFFSTDNSSYDDTSSDNTGGGGFDGGSDNSGSW